MDAWKRPMRAQMEMRPTRTRVLEPKWRKEREMGSLEADAGGPVFPCTSKWLQPGYPGSLINGVVSNSSSFIRFRGCLLLLFSWWVLQRNALGEAFWVLRASYGGRSHKWGVASPGSLTCRRERKGGGKTGREKLNQKCFLCGSSFFASRRLEITDEGAS